MKFSKLLLLILPVVLIVFVSNEISSEYKNTNGKPIEKTFRDLLKWSTSNIETKIEYLEISEEWKDIDLMNSDNYAIWIGHSTFLIKKNGFTILTDPVFSNRASPLNNIGPKRLIPPAISLDSLPNIDFVTVSHNHYDHLDIRSLKEISLRNPEAKFLVPAGDKKLLKRKKIQNANEFEWWQSYKTEDIEFIFTPVSIGQKEAYLIGTKACGEGGLLNSMIFHCFMQEILVIQMTLKKQN